MQGMGKGECRAVEGQDRRWLDFRAGFGKWIF